MQNKHLALVAIAAVLLIGGGAYSYAFRPIAQPTQQEQAASPQAEQQPEQPPSTPDAVASAAGSSYVISSADSKAEFHIKEVLRGEDFTAVGATSDVSGSITFDPQQPQSASISPIKVNARTFKTESTNRDRAIARFILKAEEANNEFVVFTPTKIEGLPTSPVKAGTSFDLKVTGNLAIAGTTKPVTFSGAAMLVDEKTLTINATAVVKHGDDFGLTIPSVPFVASVDDETTLKVSLKAVAK